MKHYLFLLFAFCLQAAAQGDDKIETDRPDQTETSATVPAGRFQMENGFNHTKEEQSSSELMLPTALSKFGINDRLEVRLTTSLVYNTASDSTSVGLEPVTIGFKVSLWKQDGLLPETSVIGAMVLPKVATGKYRKKYLAPEIQLLFSNKISDTFGVGYNFDIEWDGESPAPGYEYTLSPEFEISDKVSVYVELYGFAQEHARTDNWADSGFKFFINKNLQLDIAGGYELTGHNHYHSFFETLGISFRI